MNNLIILSPNDPDILRLTRDPDPEILAMADRMDTVDAWERLSYPGRVLAALVAIAEKGGRMRKAILAIIAAVLLAGLVYLASDNWIMALAIGLLFGYGLGASNRRFKK